VDTEGDWRKIREKFWDKDVMFNCIYLESLYQMAELAGYAGKGRDERRFLDLAEEVEIEIQTLWEPNAWKGNGAFLNIDKDNQPIPEVSVGSLGAFMLRSLATEQLESMMDLVEASFNGQYGIPCTPTDGPNAGAHKWEIERIWGDDSSWDNVNWLILKGMEMHAEREDLPMELRGRIARFAIEVDISSNEALEKYWPPSEFRSSTTGEPRRKRVGSFAWAMLPRFMKTAHRLQYLLEETA